MEPDLLFRHPRLETGKATKIGSVVRKIIGLAADINGDIYAIMNYDTEPASIYQANVLTLYKVDKTNAAMTRIGNLGITSYYENSRPPSTSRAEL